LMVTVPLAVMPDTPSTVPITSFLILVKLKF